MSEVTRSVTELINEFAKMPGVGVGSSVLTCTQVVCNAAISSVQARQMVQ